MFTHIVAKFREAIHRDRLCVATLYVDGLASQVSVVYLANDSMEIRGLPGDLPPYILFEGESVYLDREKQRGVTDVDEAAFYNLYRTWDPRVIARAEPEEVVKPEELGIGRWKARYDVRKAIHLPPTIEAELGNYVSRPQEIEFVVDRERLRELSQWDFSRRATKLTLVFSYLDEALIVPPGTPASRAA